MRILAITTLYPRPGREVFASFNRQQFRALAASHEVRVIAPVPWTARLGDRSPRGWYVNGDGLEVCHPTYFYTPKVFRYRYGESYLGSVRPAVTRLFRRWRPDVLLSCWAHPDGWAAVRIARETGLPVVIKVIGSDVLVATRDTRRRLRISEALRGADGVVAVSRDLAGYVERLGSPSGRVHVVSEGLNAKLFCPGDKAVARTRLGLPNQGSLLLFVGNLLLSKGAGVLVEACGALAARGVSFRCCLVGSGRDERRVRALVDRHGLAGRVTLAGPRPHAELPDWYRACDLVVLPSYSEGIPNVLREATACGRPFVATQVGGIPEISDPVYSRLVPPGSAPELAAAIESMLAEPPPEAEIVCRARHLSCEESAVSLTERLCNAIDHHARSCQTGTGAETAKLSLHSADSGNEVVPTQSVSLPD